MLTIVWDVDDVLNDLMYKWFNHAWVPEHPDCSLSYQDLTQNPPHLPLGVALDDYLKSMDAFRGAQESSRIVPNPHILAWFREHGSDFRHIALTARPLETAPDLASWVLRHFGRWIRCFGVVPTRQAKDVPVYDTGKGDYLKWLGKGDILIDDTPENLRQAERIGLQTVTYPQPWNSAMESIPQLLRNLTQRNGRLR
jgi:hypothetical protein